MAIVDPGKRPSSYGRAGEIEVAGARLIADPLGALIYESETMLLVSDLHLEKGSSYARRGVLLPPWDTAATLLRLADLIARWRPRMVIALGDSFHDRNGAARLTPSDRETLRALQARRTWVWIAGNHDPEAPAGFDGETAQSVAVGPLVLRHTPQAGASPGEIAGHLHPVARVVTRGGSVRRRCFVSDGERCVMPAFGAYAGGLNVRDAAYDPLFGSARRIAHVLGRKKVFAVSERSCAAD